MSAKHGELTQLLAVNGFKPARQKKHQVWKHADGRTWTMPATPSDKRALLNNLMDLRNFLRRGKVTGAFGFTDIGKSEREAFERTLHPIAAPQPKPFKERNFGIAIERLKIRPLPVGAPVKNAKDTKEERADTYQIGRAFHGAFQSLFQLVCDHEEKVYRDELRAEAVQFLANERDRDWVEKAIEEYVEQGASRVATAVRKDVEKVCRASTRIFQRIIKRLEEKERVEAREVLHSVTKKIEAASYFNPQVVGEAVFAMAFMVLNPLSDVRLTRTANETIRFKTVDGRELEPAALWDETIACGKWTGDVGVTRFRNVGQAAEEAA